MTKMNKQVGLSLLLATLCGPVITPAIAADVQAATNMVQQSNKVVGVVTDAEGPVVGASIVVKGTTNGSLSDFDGNFSIDDVKKGDIIVISYIGYETKEIAYTGQKSLSVKLSEDTKKLDEVVVTALGLKREAKALGYAVTEMKGDDLLSANSINPVASLQGKVAGVEISGSDGGMFGSTKIQIRGASTLKGNNQPIYVIDGVILDNSISNGGDADWESNSKDYGNELKNLNPDDFATVSVLKGAAATALYGSRGLNGAVVITTKSGKKNSGYGVNVTQTFGIDHVYDTPDLQMKYGQGMFAGYVDYGLDTNDRWNPSLPYNVDGKPTAIADIGMAWGLPFDGTMMEYYDKTERAYKAVKNGYKDMYRNGFNSNTNVSVTGGNDKTTFYTSLSYNKRNGVVENNTFDRLSFLAKASHQISSRVNLEASMSFANSKPRNAVPNFGEYFTGGSLMNQYDPNSLKKKYAGLHGGVASSSYGDEYAYIPGRSLWFSIYENDYSQKETMVRPSLNLNVDILDWLTFRAEGNYNYFFRRSESKELGQGYANDGGYYSLSNYDKRQANLNANFSVNKRLNDDFEVHGFVRGEFFDQSVQYLTLETNGGLIVPGQYFINNSKNQVKYEGAVTGTKRMYSVAFQAGASWKNQLFLDVTGRNDWSSALVYTNKTGNYSYFYPSVSGSWIVSETFSLPTWISFAKVRGSWAQVGNDTDPYYINTGYSLGSTQFGDKYIYDLGLATTTKSTDLKPERKNAWEVGLDWRFLQNRINVDATYYRENTKNQIMEIDVPYFSGIKTQLINAGNIQNQGVEIAVNTVPWRSKNWEWTIDFTYTKNKSKIVSLHENVADFIKLSGSVDYGNYRIGSVAQVGGEYGILMSDAKPKIDEATGLEVLAWTDYSRTAYAQRSNKAEKIGSLNPDFLGSFATGLTYKNFSVRAAFDMRFGGYVASYGSRYGLAYGTTGSSLKYREGITWTSQYADSKGITYNDGYIPQGIFAEGTKATSIQGELVTIGGMTYQECVDNGILEPVHLGSWIYRRNSWGQGVVNDDWYHKLNYIALREVSLTYRVPSTIASKIGAKNLSVTATGRNLGYLLNSLPNNENPESVRGTSATEFRLRSYSPYTASYMLTINVGF